MKARLLLLSLCLVGCTKVVEVPMPYPVEVRDTLSEWQLLTMAIAYTESKFGENAELCAGSEIEFRRVAEDGLSDDFSTICLEDII